MTAPLSLKGRALALLAQREQSELELRRKLIQHATKASATHGRRGLAAGERRDTATEEPPDPQAAREEAQARVDEVIVWLRANDYLNERRFVESRLHTRAARYGNQRIRAELSQHGLSLSGDDAATLKHSELDRAREVWQRKFGSAAPDAAGRARQARFLVGRGFSSDVVRRVVLGASRTGDEIETGD